MAEAAADFDDSTCADFSQPAAASELDRLSSTDIAGFRTNKYTDNKPINTSINMLCQYYM